MGEMLKMTMQNLNEFAEEIGSILEEENEAARRNTDAF